MLAAARNVLVSRPGLWLAAGTCTLLAALPQALIVTLGAAGGVAFLLTGDPGLALAVWKQTPGLSPGVLGAAAVALVAGFLVWARLYAIAILMSRPEEAVAWGEARAATGRLWWRVAGMHLQSYVVLALAAAVLAVAAASAGPASFGTLLLLGAVAFALARAFLRIVLSIALRAAVLDGLPSLLAWRTAGRFVRAVRHEVAITWVGLVVIGVSVWIGGRLITPVLQDTAYDYPSTSAYEIARQGVQLLVSVPLETALLAFGIAAWTALYDGAEDPRPRGRAARTEASDDPWVRRALAAGVVVALVGNALPTLVDDRFQAASDRAEARVAARDLEPHDVVGAPPERPPGERTRYRVAATLDDDELSWTTAISYLNDTGETLDDVGIHVYANAYTRPLEEIPFAADLVASDFNGEFQALADPGEMNELTASVAGRGVSARPNGTALLVDLRSPLAPGERVAIEIGMTMDLPHFSERFGRWEDLTLLGNWIPVVAERGAGSWRLDPFGSIGDPFFAAASDYRVSIRADENVSVVGTGSLVSVSPGEGRTRVWEFDAPAVRDAAYAAAPFLRGLEATAAGTTVRSWYPAGGGARAEVSLEAAASAVEDYTSRYGGLPWPEVDVVETESRLGGMEYPGTVFVSSGSESFAGLPLLPELVSYSGFEEARARYVVGHEIAHQWWYAAVGNDQVREPWLDEAFAEASTRLWLEEQEDGDRTWLMTNLTPDPPATAAAVRSGVGDFDSNESYTQTIYLQGAEVLMELRDAVGRDSYDAVMRAWYERSVPGIGTIAGFVETVRDVAGERGEDVMRRYVSSGGA
ncbi:MAG TPA: M1 family metallopeptidase [Actinomycetota bacterium]|nr:M1 family metallopeptidase [Actinomycetota bacterium]